jgi:drug/metabolite transporter (DMT)-like permease
MKNGVLFVLLSTIGLSLKGLWARLAYAEGMDVSGVLFYRSALAAPLLVGGGLWLLRRTGSSKSVGLRALVPSIMMGALFSIGMTCDFQAIAHLGASVSRVILFGFPLLVLAFESIATRRLPRREQFLGFVVAWLGLSAVASGGLSNMPGLSQSGAKVALLWSVASLFLYALYTWLSGRVAKQVGSVRLTMASQLTTGAVLVSFLLYQGGGSPPPAPPLALFWVACMVLVSTVIPYFLITEGIARLGSSDASLLAMGGPVLTVFAGWMVLGEKLSWIQLLGTAAVILGVGLTQRKSAPLEEPVSQRGSAIFMPRLKGS